MKPTDAPKLKVYKGKTQWQEHLQKVKKENPHCKYWSELKIIADEEWKLIPRKIIHYNNDEKPKQTIKVYKKSEFQLFMEKYEDTDEGKKEGFKEWKRIKLEQKKIEQENNIIKVNLDEDSEWVKHLKKINIENPDIITYKELREKAIEEWLKLKNV